MLQDCQPALAITGYKAGQPCHDVLPSQQKNRNVHEAERFKTGYERIDYLGLIKPSKDQVAPLSFDVNFAITFPP